MEPINFIYLGSQVQIENPFKRAGWYKADPSTLSNTLQAILVAVRNDQSLTAPVTPSYLNAWPETVAFEKPTDANTLVQRHHTRIWRTDFTIGDQPTPGSCHGRPARTQRDRRRILHRRPGSST